MFTDLLSKKDATVEVEKQVSTKSLLRLPRLSFNRWKSLGVVSAFTSGINRSNEDRGTRYVTVKADPMIHSTNQARETGASPRKQPVIIQEYKHIAAAPRQPSTSRDRRPRSQERRLLTTTTIHPNESSRSRSRSKLAFTRSHSNPGYQRIVKLQESPAHHGKGSSVSYQKDRRAEDDEAELVEVSRGRRSRHSSISTSRVLRSENRTPSPVPELTGTAAGTPCSDRFFEPSTPKHCQINFQLIQPKERSPITSYDKDKEIEQVNEFSSMDSDFYAYPENYYKVYQSRCSNTGTDSTRGDNSQRTSRNTSREAPRHRKPVTGTNLSDGSRLRSVSTGRGRVTATTSRISSIPILEQSPHTLHEPIFPPPVILDNKISSNPSMSNPEALQAGLDSSQHPVINPRHESLKADTLPRKPVSFERLRPSLMAYQAELPSPPSDQRPPHHRSKSETIQTEQPLARSHTRSISSYSYTPSRDPRPERRSYNTVRFLDSQGQNHERLRRVLGI